MPLAHAPPLDEARAIRNRADLHLLRFVRAVLPAQAAVLRVRQTAFVGTRLTLALSSVLQTDALRSRFAFASVDGAEGVITYV